MKFADIKNDVAFRKIFGNKKKTYILVSFLNAVLQLEGDHRIATVKIENPYQFPRIAGEKGSIIDVRATEIGGRQFIVEMQVAEQDGFDKRALYYSSREYSMQIDRGDSYTKLKPTIFIGILSFKYFKGTDYLSYHSLADEQTNERTFRDMRFAFIELPKFKKKVDELTSLIDKWTFFVKNAEKLEMIPENVDDDGLKEAYIDADQYKWTKRELKDYDNSYIAQQDAKGVIVAAEKKAKEEGKQEGKEEMILAMAQSGMGVAQIAKIAQKTVAEVELIIADHKNEKQD